MPAFLLSPYRPPTSYPAAVGPDEAAAWLSGYFALWHPAVVRRAGLPQLASFYDHADPADGAVYVAPLGPPNPLPGDWPDRVSAAGGVQVGATADRADTLAKLLAAIGAEAGDPTVSRWFAGVGFAYLLVETLFEAANHDPLLDLDGFRDDVTNATAADSEAAVREHLSAAADKLRAARDGMNGNPFYVADLLVPDPDRLSTPVPGSPARGLPLTVVAPAELLRRMRDEHPERSAELSAAEVACGGWLERADDLLPPESQWWNLAAGRAAVRELFGSPPAGYGRTRPGMHAHLPGWLRHAGFSHAVVLNPDGATAPIRDAAVANWPGPDGKLVDVFGRAPLPADDPRTFFHLGHHLHKAAGSDSAPVVALAHRGRPPAVGYDELVAAAELGRVPAEFTTVGGYLSAHHYGEYLGAAAADDFFADHLEDRVSRLSLPDPVSGFARHLRLRRRVDSALALAALHRTLTPPAAADDAAVLRLEELERAVEVDKPDAGGLADAEAYWAARLADRVLARSPAGRPGYLVLNPCGFARRVGLELDPFPGPIRADGPVKAAQFDADRTRLVVEVPALGFAWVPRAPDGPVGGSPVRKWKAADGTTARNEFVEAEVDPATGMVRAIRDLRTRVSRLGVQLVFRPGSRMRATVVRVTRSGPAVGEVTAEGEVTDLHDAVLATFRLTVRAWAGRPAIELGVELDPVRPPAGPAWHAYYAARVGWRDERAALFRGVGGGAARTTHARPGSPEYLEVRLGAERSFVFTGGLPFAQASGNRAVDVVLVPPGETARRFDLLFAFDRDYPALVAAGWTAPAVAVPTDKGPPPTGPSGWLADLDLPSVLLTSLRPVVGRRAVTARMVETAGFGGTADLRFAVPPTAAMMVDGDGEDLHPLSPADGAVPLEFSASEAFRLRADFDR